MNRLVWAIGREGFGSYQWNGQELVSADGSPTEILSPGLVDIHIHGAHGIDFMTASREEMVSLANQLEDLGYEGWLPTTVTASAADVRLALDHLPDHPSILGFHLEGPFISPHFAGAQPPEDIVGPPIPGSEWDEILDDERLRVITLAPEQPGALDLAARLSARGVKVSMGHTNATFEEARRGWDAGVRHVTHTFNAMRPFHHREAGAVGFALSQEGLKAELIYDRLHVSSEATKVLVRAKGLDDIIAVSDSTMASGLKPGTEFSMWGHPCIVGNGDVRLRADGTLAGSAITLKGAFQNLLTDFGPELAIRACCHNPRCALGLPSAPRVFLVWSMDGELKDRIEL